jgi:hypothetical protein
VINLHIVFVRWDDQMYSVHNLTVLLTGVTILDTKFTVFIHYYFGLATLFMRTFVRLYWSGMLCM